LELTPPRANAITVRGDGAETDGSLAILVKHLYCSADGR
jgi:hypothetical protein